MGRRMKFDPRDTLFLKIEEPFRKRRSQEEQERDELTAHLRSLRLRRETEQRTGPER